MKKKTRGKKAVAPGTADLSAFIDDIVVADKKSEAHTLKTKEGVNDFIDQMMSDEKSMKARARKKSEGATAGLVKSLDPFVRKMTARALSSSDTVSQLKRSNEENFQAIRRLSNSISVLENRIGDLTEQSNKTMGALGDLMTSFKQYKDDVEKKFKKIESDNTKQQSLIGDIIDAAVGKAVKTAMGAATSVVRSALSAVTGAGVASAAAVGATAYGLWNMREKTKETFGESYEKGDLNKIKNQAIRQGLTGMAASDAELEQIGSNKEAAEDILQSGNERDISRYGKENLEKIAKGEKLSIDDMKKNIGKPHSVQKIEEKIIGAAKGPQESEAIKKARAESESKSEVAAANLQAKKEEKPKGDATKTDGPGAGSGVGSGSATGVGETGSSSKAMTFLTGKGWTTEQSAGIVGNLQAESGPDMRTNAVGDGGKAYGIAQWHPDRQGNFKKQYGKDIREAGFEAQLEFLHWELNNTEAAAGRALKAAKTASEAAEIFDKLYERSSGAHRAQRIANAEAIMKGQKGAKPDATPMTAPEGSNAPNAEPTKQEKGVVAPGEAPASNPKAGEAKDASAGYKPSPGEASGLSFAPGTDKNINEGIAKKVAQLQSMVGNVLITSGYRDPQRNKEAGGAKNSAHLSGDAVDITFAKDKDKTLKVVEAASKIGIGGIGVYEPGWIHVDTGDRRAWGRDYSDKSIPDWAKDVLNAHVTGKMGEYDASARGGRTQQREGGGDSRSEGGAPSAMAQRILSGGARGMSTINAAINPTGRGSVMPSIAGQVGMTPGLGPLSGLLSTMMTGSMKNMVPQSPTGIIGLVGSLLNSMSPQNRGNNPQFAPDKFQDNSVPSALPSANILREVFGMEVQTAYRP